MADYDLELLREYRSNCIRDGNSSLESFEKALITLFGLSLTVSVALGNELLKSRSTIECAHYLWLAWIIWSGAMLLTLGGFLCSHLIFEKLVAAVDEYMAGTCKEIKPSKSLSSFVRLMNWVSLAFFALGLACFLLFAACNF